MSLKATTTIIHNGRSIKKGDTVVAAGKGIKSDVALPSEMIQSLIAEGAIVEETPPPPPAAPAAPNPAGNPGESEKKP